MGSLFVEADEPLLVFPSVEVAEWYLEAEDVRNGVYPRAYGPNGEQFSVEAEGRRVVIHPSGASPNPDGLTTLLRRALAAVGEPASQDTQLQDLVAAAEAFWEKRDPTLDRFSHSLPWWGCLLLVASVVGVAILLLRFLRNS